MVVSSRTIIVSASAVALIIALLAFASNGRDHKASAQSESLTSVHQIDLSPLRAKVVPVMPSAIHPCGGYEGHMFKINAAENARDAIYARVSGDVNASIKSSSDFLATVNGLSRVADVVTDLLIKQPALPSPGNEILIMVPAEC